MKKELSKTILPTRPDSIPFQIETKLFELLERIFSVTADQFQTSSPPNPKLGDLAVSLHFFVGQNFSAEQLMEKINAHKNELLAISPIKDFQLKNLYLNIFYNRSVFVKQVLQNQNSLVAPTVLTQPETVVIEYSSPNTNKPLHLGHVRNNLIGMALANLLAKAGYKVIRTCLVNDRGVHICKSLLAYQKFGQGETPTSSGLKGDHLVGKYYVIFETELKKEMIEYAKARSIDLAKLFGQARADFEKEFYKVSRLNNEALELLKKWEQGDEATIALWKKLNSWIYSGFAQTYDKLGSKFDKIYYESDTYILGKSIVNDGIKAGVFTKNDAGLVTAKLKNGEQKVLIRPDGTTVYLTQDLGTVKQKYHDFQPNYSIYIVGSEQDYYFKVLFEIIKQIGLKSADYNYHLSYGMVELPEGKMKSREGTVVDADELIAHLTELAEKKLDENNRRDSQLAQKIALAALKFYFLKSSNSSTVVFNPQKSLELEGMTGPYLQYVLARIKSILAKTGDIETKDPNYGLLVEDEELNIIKQLAEYPDVIYASAATLDPSLIANYLGKLAQSFNHWYHRYNVLKSPPELKQVRFGFIQAIVLVIEDGLILLGISPIDQM